MAYTILAAARIAGVNRLCCVAAVSSHTGSVSIGASAAGCTAAIVNKRRTGSLHDGQGERAGSAAAWLGALQFGAAAGASALVAARADGTAAPAATVMLGAAVVACATRWWTTREARIRETPYDVA